MPYPFLTKKCRVIEDVMHSVAIIGTLINFPTHLRRYENLEAMKKILIPVCKI